MTPKVRIDRQGESEIDELSNIAQKGPNRETHPPSMAGLAGLPIDTIRCWVVLYISRIQMDTLTLKAMLHESIENIHDSELLLAMKELGERKYTPEAQPHLSPAQVARIEESKRQIRAGQFITNEEADAIVDKWLNA